MRQSDAARLLIADFLLAAWFLWITPADAALSSLRLAAAASVLACSASPASAASRKRRTADFSADFTDLLRSCAASFCRLRLIWDLMFATGQASIGVLVGLGWWCRTDAGATGHATTDDTSGRGDRPNPRGSAPPSSGALQGPAALDVPEPGRAGCAHTQPRRRASQAQDASAHQSWWARRYGEECGTGSSRRSRK